MSKLNNIKTLREIVDGKRGQDIDGVLVDVWTAKAILKVFDNLTNENQASYEMLPIKVQASFAYKLLRKYGS